jgi:hypothetical protein
MNVGALAHDLSHQSAYRLQNVFAVVENQQQLLGAQEVEHQVGRGRTGARIQTKDLDHGVRHRLRIAHAVQFAQPRAVSKVRDHRGGHLER